MDVRELVREHYSPGGLTETVLTTVSAMGVDTEHLTAEALSPIDHLHAGGAPATRHLLDRLGIVEGQRLLDVGSGIGGPSRLAASYGARVTGIDLTPRFVATAQELTARVGMSEAVDFVVTPGESLPFADDSFDGAFMVHVGMNIPDKRAVFGEVHRVLKPGARFGVYEQMRIGTGDLPFPMPWAEDERTSFVESLEDYRAALEAAGFTVEEVEDVTAGTLGPAPGGPMSPATVFGPAFVERIANDLGALRAGLLGTIVVLARA